MPARRARLEQVPGRVHEGQDFRRDAVEFVADRVRGDRLEPEAAPQRIVMGEQAGDLLVERIRLGEIHEPDRPPADLVLVGRADAALRRPDLQPFDAGGFAMGVELAVQREDQRDILGDLEIVRRDRDALRLELGDLVHEMMRIEHDAVADDRELARPHDARGQQRQLVDLVADDERMAGVVAALEAHHDIGLERQPIDDLALAFVAPLGADHHHIRHRSIALLIPPDPRLTKRPLGCATK